MRNAVIRKKVLREQAIIRRYLLTPVRWVAPAENILDWSKLANQRLWIQ